MYFFSYERHFQEEGIFQNQILSYHAFVHYYQHCHPGLILHFVLDSRIRFTAHFKASVRRDVSCGGCGCCGCCDSCGSCENCENLNSKNAELTQSNSYVVIKNLALDNFS